MDTNEKLEHMIYRTTLSEREIAERTNTPAWEVRSMMHDVRNDKEFRMCNMRRLLSVINQQATGEQQLNLFIKCIQSIQYLLYDRDLSEAEIADLKTYASRVSDIRQELLQLYYWRDLPDFELIQKVHTYTDSVYARILMHIHYAHADDIPFDPWSL